MKSILFVRTLGISSLLLLLTSWSAQVLATSAPIYSFTGLSGVSVKRSCSTVLGNTTCTGEVDSPQKATDSDFTTPATIQIPLSVLGARVGLRLDMASRAPANYRAGILAKSNGSLLDLTGVSLTNLLRIKTYLKGSDAVVESRAVDVAVVRALLNGSSPVRLEFLATKPFDQIEIEAAALASAAYGLDVFYGYGIDANLVTTAKGYVSRFSGNLAANYSTTIKPNGVTVCANSNVSNPANTVDADLTNYATFGTFLSVNCPTTLQTQLEGKAPAGYEAGFVIGSGSVLDATVLSGLSVATYLNGVAQETASGVQLLNLQLLSDGKYAVNFETSKAFDRVEIRQNSALSALNDLHVYYGFGLEPSVYRDQEPVLSNFSAPANQFQASQYKADGGLLCVACGATNPEYAADGNLDGNYALLNNGVGLAGTTSLKLKLNGPGFAGNTAGIVLGGASGLLDANVLSSMQVKTYSGANGGALVESAGGADLLRLEVLADGRQEVSFATTQNFDWVEIEIANGVSVLDATKVYYAFAQDQPTGFPTNIVISAPLPVELVQFGATATGTAVVLTWQTASERNSDHFVVERATGGSKKNFTAIGRVSAAGTSTARRSYSLRDEQVASLGIPVLYYRLRQIDQDGSEQFSTIVVVNLKVPGQIALYPNPASSTDKVRLILPAASAEGTTLAVYNTQAQLVSQQLVAGPEAELSTTGLRAGIYQVVFTDAAGQRFATQHLVISGR